jgi:hypothetical protein
LELLLDVVEVRSDRAGTQGQELGDLRHALAAREVDEHFELALGKRIYRVPRPLRP